MAVFGGVMSKIEFGENWRDRYGIYYERARKRDAPHRGHSTAMWDTDFKH